MFWRSLPVRRPLALVLALGLSGLPALAAAAGPPAPLPPPTPIADSAARAAVNQRYHRGHDDNAALKWTGFGLIAGGGSLIAIGAVLDDEDCFDHGYSYYDCDDVRKTAFVAGGIMAGVGVGLMIMASTTGRHHYPSVTMQRGRMLVQQRVRF